MNQDDMREKIAELEKMATNILELKRNNKTRRPLVIEFSGSPKSGKTSCISALELFLKRNGFSVKIITERSENCPVNSKLNPLFNVWTLCSIAREYSVIFANNLKEYDIVITDRGIFDAMTWFMWLRNKKYLDEDSFAKLDAFVQFKEWRYKIDLIYILTAKPEISLNREYSKLVTRKYGSIMNVSVLNEYLTTLENAKNKYSSIFRKIESIDTSEMDLDKLNYYVAKNTLNILGDMISERIAYVNINCLPNLNKEIFKYDIIRMLGSKLEIGPRQSVEKDSNKIQLLPICVITNKDRSKILVAKKNFHQVSDTSPEKSKLLLYYGGHVRQEDILPTENQSLEDIIRSTLDRELGEELGIKYYAKDDNPLCIWIKTNNRSKKHLAICHILEVDFNTFKYRLSNVEFAVSGRTLSGRVMNVEDVISRYKELENWSKAIMREIYKYNDNTDQYKLPE